MKTIVVCKAEPVRVVDDLESVNLRVEKRLCRSLVDADECFASGPGSECCHDDGREECFGK